MARVQAPEGRTAPTPSTVSSTSLIFKRAISETSFKSRSAEIARVTTGMASKSTLEITGGSVPMGRFWIAVATLSRTS